MPENLTKSEPPIFAIKGQKIILSWKAVWVMMGLMISGGGILGIVRLATTEDVEAAELKMDKKVEVEKQDRINADVRFDIRLGTQEKAALDLATTVDEVQKVQHWQVAEQAAERVSKQAPKSKQKEAYKRLFKQNLDRLNSKGGKKMPCANLDCTND